MNSSDEDMERLLLRYFVNDEWAARGYQSLTSIFEQVGRPACWRNSFFDRLAAPEEKGALSAILERMNADGLLESKKPENGQEIFYRASGNALKTERYEQIYPSLVNAKEGATLPIGVDSAKWTGLPRRGILNEEAVEKLKVALTIIDNAIEKSNATNEERAQARAFAIAIHALADAPEPPADLIWTLVNRANQLSGIASFFVSIAALFAAVAH